MSNPYPEYKRNTIMLPVAEQPAQQEPVDKKGSPCPEFWDWLPKAYNFEGIGNFTKYNMEVAFLAGMQTTSPPASKPWVGLTDEEWQEIDASLNGKRDLARIFVKAIEAKLKEKNA